MPSFRQEFPSIIGTAVLLFAGLSASAPPAHPTRAPRAAQQPGVPHGRFANLRMLPFESETIRVSLGPSGVPVPVASAAPSSAPPSGSLTPALAHDVVRSHIPELAACAASGVMNGRVHGTITLRIVVDPRGGIRDVAVPQSTLIWSVPRCITEAVRGWRFPAPPDGLTIVIVAPFAFTSE